MRKPQKQPIDRRIPHHMRHTVDTHTGCWNFDGARDEHGYGFMKIPGGGGRACNAHRYYYEYYVGTIPYGLVLDHLCRNHSCVNPEHLEPVTQGENTRRGVLHKKVLTSDDVAEIVRLREQGYSRKYVAELFGISGPHVSNICAGRRGRGTGNQLRDDCRSVFYPASQTA